MVAVVAVVAIVAEETAGRVLVVALATALVVVPEPGLQSNPIEYIPNPQLLTSL